MIAGLASLAGFAQGGMQGAFQVDVSFEEVTKTAGGFTSQTLTTFPVTVTPSGGTPAYTYSWVRISGSSAITATASTSASTAFSATLAPDESVFAVFECTVTDATGATAKVQVSVEISLVGYS